MSGSDRMRNVVAGILFCFLFPSLVWAGGELRGVRLSDNQGKTRVVLDLSKVEFMDSSGLGAVVGSMKQLGRDRQLDLAGLTPTVDKVFRITRMDRVFRIYDTAEAALQDIAHAT